MKVVDWHDPHQVCAIAESVPDPGSALSSMIANKGGATMIPCLLKIAQGDAYGHKDSPSMLESDRANAIPMLVQLGAATPNLSEADRRVVQETTVRGLRDSDELIREVTVRAVGDFGTPDLIPVLEDIARFDPYSRPKEDTQGGRYDLRELAAEAIRSIQSRSKTN